MSNINLSLEQLYAINAMHSARNVFITGKAGTGKSTLIENFRQNTNKKVVYLAPTGLAANNIMGVTIHSFFKLSIGPQVELTSLSKEDIQLLQNIDTIVIDEISMVRSDVLTAIDSRLRAVCHDQPFGGKQLIVVGDFYQLPPIVQTFQEEIYLDELGGSLAFKSKSWLAANFNNIELNQVHRQSGDRLFIDILNKVRVADLFSTDLYIPELGDVDAITALNFKISQSKQSSQPTYLCLKNSQVNKINAHCCNKLTGQSSHYNAFKEGYWDWSDFPAEKCIEVKPGVRVMLLCNAYSNSRTSYSNGTVGTVLECHQNHILVQVGNEVVPIYKREWANYKYSMFIDNDGELALEQKKVGSFSQLPVRLAYAMTIHKSQGMSIDEVHLSMSEHRSFARSQLYTAISRCRSINGLTSDDELSFNDITVNPEVAKFYQQLNT